MAEDMLDVILLTKSHKHEGYCVAGIERATGHWVRLVTTRAEMCGSLAHSDLCLDAGPTERVRMLKPLDRILIRSLGRKPSSAQPENVLVVPREKQYLETVSWEVVLALHPYDAPTMIYGDTARYLLNYRGGLGYSLTMVFVERLTLTCEKNAYGRERAKAAFDYNGRHYAAMSVTDLEYSPSLGQRMFMERAALVVSLAEKPLSCDTEMRTYKLVAAVYPLSPMDASAALGKDEIFAKFADMRAARARESAPGKEEIFAKAEDVRTARARESAPGKEEIFAKAEDVRMARARESAPGKDEIFAKSTDMRTARARESAPGKEEVFAKAEDVRTARARESAPTANDFSGDLRDAEEAFACGRYASACLAYLRLIARAPEAVTARQLQTLYACARNARDINLVQDAYRVHHRLPGEIKRALNKDAAWLFCEILRWALANPAPRLSDWCAKEALRYAEYATGGDVGARSFCERVRADLADARLGIDPARREALLRAFERESGNAFRA